MKKFTLLMIAALMLNEHLVKAQKINVKSTNTIGFDASVAMYEEFFQSGLALDNQGNKIIVGGFDGKNVAFDASNTITSDSNSNIFIAKYNSENVLLWLKNIGGKSASTGWWGTADKNANDAAVSVKTDASNNIYILAVANLSTTDVLDFDVEHPATNSILETGDERDKDIVLAKYAPDGTLLWIKVVGDEYIDRALKMTLDHNNHIWITGIISGSTGNDVDFDRANTHADGADLLEGQFRHLGFIAHYDNDGNFRSVKGIGEGLFSELNIQVGASGNVYVAGSFNGSGVNLFLNDPTPTLIKSDGFHEFSPQNQDIFLMKYTVTGDIHWVKTISSPSFNRVSDLIIDEHENLFITGWFNGSNVDFDTDNDLTYDVKSSVSNGSAFVAKYSTEGTLAWVNTVAGGTSSRARTLDLFNGYLVCSGEYSGSNVLFGNVVLNSSSNPDAFIALLNTHGTWIDTKAFPSPLYSSITNLKVGTDGTIHFVGFNAHISDGMVDVKDMFFGETTADILALADESTVSNAPTFSVFPNPSNDIVYIHKNGSEKIAFLELNTATGQVVVSETYPELKSLDIRDQPKGVYVLKITTETGGLQTVKIIKN